MSEPLALVADPEPASMVAAVTADAGARLAFETALLAGRLAAFLRRALPAEEGSLAAGVAFLERAYRAAAGDRPVASWPGGPLDRRPPGADHPLDRLAELFALSPFEVDLILLAGLGEEHEGFADLLRTLHPQGRPFATVGLAAQLFAPGAAERRALRRTVESGPARRAGIFDLDGDGPLFGRSVVLAEALWSALLGIDAWPARLAPEPPPALALWGLESWLATPAAQCAARTLASGWEATVLVTAEDPETACERAAVLAAAAGVETIRLRVPAGAAGTAGEPAAESIRLAGLHAIARGAVPLFRAAAAEGGGPAVLPRLDGHPGPVLIAAPAGAAQLRGHRPLVAVPCDRLTPTDLGRMWAEAVPDLVPEAPLLAARYPLEPAGARDAAADLGLMARLSGRPPGLEDVAAAVRARAGAVVGGAVQLVRPTARWDQLVLPAAKLAQLREAVDRLLHQRRVLDDWRFLAGRPGARGVRALLAGPPGTGKSFSAEVLAGALGVDLLVVDLSRVVSKWIGETEKNLSEVFASAEKARAVLLFDEADALFGKRTEVSDAHDRYANLETAYLLSRLERFEGLALLATNLRQNIDPAFTRRLEFVLDFDEPGREERLALWRCHLPAAAPVAPDVSLPEIAGAYPLVGGLIKNAAVAAAFLAAAAGRPIDRSHLLHAIQREYQKAGKAFPGPPHGAAAAITH
jgi:ATPase family protein associated with various cellular activities (AAA)/winged helix domain-containing protein